MGRARHRGGGLSVGSLRPKPAPRRPARGLTVGSLKSGAPCEPAPAAPTANREIAERRALERGLKPKKRGGCCHRGCSGCPVFAAVRASCGPGASAGG